MRTLSALFVGVLAACGGADVALQTDAPAASDQVLAPPAGSVHWTFTSATVQGSFDIVKAPAGNECRTLHLDGTVTACADLVNLSGTATVGADTGTATGTEAPSNGIFGLNINVGGRRLIITGTENGTSFSGYLARGFTNEAVVGTSP